MKTVKRIVAVMFLLLLIWAVGYLFYSGSRLLYDNSNSDDYRDTIYQANNKEYYLEISDTLEANLYHQGIGKTLTYDSFEDGILTYKCADTPYYFVSVSEGLYDLQLNVAFRRC